MSSVARKLLAHHLGVLGRRVPRLRGSPIARSFCEKATTNAKAAAADATTTTTQKSGSGLGKLVLVAGFGLAGYGFYDRYTRGAEETEESIVNWSGTHGCTPKKLHEPETVEEVEELVRKCHDQGRRLRPVGNALSPNGIALSDDEMVSLAMMDKVLSVDKKRMRVRVQPGCSVGNLCKELRKHGLVLQNLASIAEQQVGGFIQIGAHGTGAAIPPVEMQCLEMKVATPGEGSVTLRRDDDPEVFRMVQCGLGMFGVVTEVTIQCVPSHKLLEHTFTLTKSQVEARHSALIKRHKHVRYHWIPYTDHVVVTTCDDYSLWNRLGLGMPKNSFTEEERLKPLRDLVMASESKTPKDLEGLSFADLRTMLLEKDPLDVEHIKSVNRAEAEFWKRSEGYRTGYSDEILQFDCGGQQWVLEMAVNAGTLAKPSYADIEYMKRLLKEIKDKEVPAPAPIEQRWTASSEATLSPAASPDSSGLYSWIGIIMYLPLNDTKSRALVTRRFESYVSLMRGALEGLQAQEHWAKIELPGDSTEREEMVRRVRGRYPVDRVKALKSRFDPKNILGSQLLDTLFG